jgi:hypothetical protein
LDKKLFKTQRLEKLFALMCGLADDPRGHAALILDDGSFYGVDKLCPELRGEVHEEGFVDAETFDAVGGAVMVAGKVLVGHADGGGEPAKE